MLRGGAPALNRSPVAFTQRSHLGGLISPREERNWSSKRPAGGVLAKARQAYGGSRIFLDNQSGARAEK
eukprot:11125207-Alexandrium_andersonii.AAC.1